MGSGGGELFVVAMPIVLSSACWGGRFRGLEGKVMRIQCCVDSQTTPVSCGGKMGGVCSRVCLMGSGENGDCLLFLLLCICLLLGKAVVTGSGR